MIVVKCDKCLAHVAVLVVSGGVGTGWLDALTVQAEKDCCKRVYKLAVAALRSLGLGVREVK